MKCIVVLMALINQTINTIYKFCKGPQQYDPHNNMIILYI